MSWMTKNGQVKKMHFLTPAGVPICSLVSFHDGPALSAFTSPFIERDPFIHLCTMCRRECRKLGMPETACICGKCGLKARSAQHPGPTRTEGSDG